MITMSKLAKLSHFSVSTVSKAFSMSDEVNEQTREIIFEIARKNGCFKKYFNAKYPKYIIAVICPELKGRYYSNMVSLLGEYLSGYNCEICVASTEFSEETELNLLKYYNQYASVDGIIIIDGKSTTDPPTETPIVSIGGNSINTGICITYDYKPSFTEAIDYFISKNITSIGFIGEKKTSRKLRDFNNIILEKIGSSNEPFISISDNRFEKGGYCAMENLFSSGNLPRAIICAYDYMAIGAIRCIYDHGLSVPDNIAVLGINDIPELPYLNPPLSSINTMPDMACKMAADSVIGLLTEGTHKSRTVIIPELKLRRSTEII